MTNTTIVEAYDYETLAQHVAAHAPNAYRLNHVTACAGDDCHAIWLDETRGTVWHAHTTLDMVVGKGFPWTLEREPAAEAAEWIEETLILVLENLADPVNSADYARRPDRADEDLEAVQELQAVQLAAYRRLHPTPADVDAAIVHEMGVVRRQLRHLSLLRSRNLSDVFGTERGAASRAAEALDVEHESARKVLGAWTRYADTVTEGAQEAYAMDHMA